MINTEKAFRYVILFCPKYDMLYYTPEKRVSSVFEILPSLLKKSLRSSTNLSTLGYIV